ncbi:MAG: hypothetical protein ACPLIG_03900 [Candidatus Bathyarchaeales archaeon]
MEVKGKLTKIAIIKLVFLSVAMVVLMFAILAPIVNADTKTATSGSYFGEGVGAGVAATNIGGQYYYCAWHVGRWQGSCERIEGDLYFTLYSDGLPMYGSTSMNTYDTAYSGPLTSLGASAYSYFYDSRIGYFVWNSGLAWLP